jgi:hypothetical protein
MPAVSRKDLAPAAVPASSAEWPTVDLIEDDEYGCVATQPAVSVPLAVRAPAPSAQPPPLPSTVIPVPVLPSVHSTPRAGGLAPVVRTTPAPPPRPHRAPARLATGTPELSIGDRTKPGIVMPSAARAVELPSIRRGMASRR